MLCRLHKTQELLYDSTRDFLSLRFDHRENEKQWMIEKDRLLHELDACHQRLQLDRQPTPNVNVLDVSKLHDDFLGGPVVQQEDLKVSLMCLYECHFFQHITCIFYFYFFLDI